MLWPIISGMPKMKWCVDCGRENFGTAESCDQCRSTNFQAHAPPKDQPKPSHEGEVGCLAFLGIGAALFWAAYSFLYAPSQPDPSGHPSVRQPTPGVAYSAEGAVGVALSTYLPADSDWRLELMKGNNLDIYVSRKAFEDVAFPDRPNFIEQVGKAWCVGVQTMFIPAVRLRDVRTGKVMGSYRCVLGHVTVEGQ